MLSIVAKISFLFSVQRIQAKITIDPRCPLKWPILGTIGFSLGLQKNDHIVINISWLEFAAQLIKNFSKVASSSKSYRDGFCICQNLQQPCKQTMKHLFHW